MTEKPCGYTSVAFHDNPLSIQKILVLLKRLITEEEAWALCYQTAKTLSTYPKEKFHTVSLSRIYLRNDGTVLLRDVADAAATNVSEKEMVFSLGLMIYEALDFHVNKEEERMLSSDLSNLMTVIASTNNAEYGTNTEEHLQKPEDEGIERDVGIYEEDISPTATLENVLQVCVEHTNSSVEHADAHYRAVIQALMEKVPELEQEQTTCNDDGIKHNSTSLQRLDTLGSNDWTDVRIWRAIQARFWVQVIRELRRGVKLKKVGANLNSRDAKRGNEQRAEFELTPYETLMDDIRERRYRLRKTPSTTPYIRRDVHSTILEFIRSRPPLKKVSERQLPPLQKEYTLRELLMESIKKPPKPLRVTRRQSSSNKAESPFNKQADAGDVKENESPTVPRAPRRDLEIAVSPVRKPRRVIPVDFDLKLDADDDDDDDDDDYNDEFTVTRFEEEDNESSNYWQLKEEYAFGDRDAGRIGHKDHEHRDDDEVDSANPWKKTGGLRLTRNEYHRFCDAQLESYDLATQCPSRRASARKHAARRAAPVASLTGTTSLPHSRPQSRQHTGVAGSTLSQGPSPNISLNPSPSLSPQPRARQPRRANTIAEGRDHEDQSSKWQDEGGQKPTLGDMFLDERLSLTLEEIVHIRSVLTKAELESLPVEGRVKEDVEKRRVCFLCLKTRFGILGPWGQRCRLCDRTVCVKCYSKMRIPTEHFAHVPVVLLSPGLLLSPSSSEPDTSGKGSWLRGSGAVGSAPASPASRRKDSALRSTPASTPTVTPVSVPTPTSTLPSHLEKRSYKPTGSPAALSTTKAFSTLTSQTPEQRLVAERLRGVAMVVCHDCRIMVIQIIKSSRTTRATIRNNVISRLTLNLSPAYV